MKFVKVAALSSFQVVLIIAGSSCPNEFKRIQFSLQFVLWTNVNLVFIFICVAGEKVGAGNVCLWCNEKGRSFYSTEAVQSHMTDKSHCKLFTDGDAALEFADFYDFRSFMSLLMKNKFLKLVEWKQTR